MKFIDVINGLAALECFRNILDWKIKIIFSDKLTERPPVIAGYKHLNEDDLIRRHCDDRAKCTSNFSFPFVTERKELINCSNHMQSDSVAAYRAASLLRISPDNRNRPSISHDTFLNRAVSVGRYNFLVTCWGQCMGACSH